MGWKLAGYPFFLSCYLRSVVSVITSQNVRFVFFRTRYKCSQMKQVTPIAISASPVMC